MYVSKYAILLALAQYQVQCKKTTKSAKRTDTPRNIFLSMSRIKMCKW